MIEILLSDGHKEYAYFTPVIPPKTSVIWVGGETYQVMEDVFFRSYTTQTGYSALRPIVLVKKVKQQ